MLSNPSKISSLRYVKESKVLELIKKGEELRKQAEVNYRPPK